MRRDRLVLAALSVLAGALSAGAAAGQTRYSLTLYEQPDYRGASVTLYGDHPAIGTTGFASRARSAQVRGTWRVCQGGGYRDRCEVLTGNVRDLAAYGLAGRVGSAQLIEGAYAAAPQTYSPPASTSSYPAPPAPAYAPPGGVYGPRGPAYASPAYPPTGAYPPAYSGAPAYGARPDDGRSVPYPEGGYPPDPYNHTPRSEPAYPPALDAPPSGPARGEFGRSRSDERGAEGRTAVFFPQPEIRGQAVSAWSARAADDFCRAEGLGPSIYFDRSERAGAAVDPDGRAVGEGPVLTDVLCRR